MWLIIVGDGTLTGEGIDTNLPHAQWVMMGRWPTSLEGDSHNM